MNLVNELNERRYTPARITQIYYDEIYFSIRKFRHSGLEVNQDNYYKSAESDSRLDHVSYEEFKKLVELEEAYEKHLAEHPVGRFSSRPGGIKGEEYRREIISVTNKALIRRVAQDMCEDAKTISTANYDFLYQLGYRGEQESAIPEIVRGNFKMFLKKKFLEQELSGCNEAIDRMKHVLKIMEGQRGGLDDFLIDRYFVTMPIDNVRRQLARSRIAPVKDYREKFLSDFYEEKMQRMMKHMDFDVENVQGKTIKKMMDGTLLPDESVYKKISDLGYNEKEGHPLIRSGYGIYVQIYALNKAKIQQLDKAKLLYREVCGIPGVREYLEGDELPDGYPLVGVANTMKYIITKSRYKKGKVSKQEFDEANAVLEQDYRYGMQTRLSPNIKGMEKVDYDSKRDVSFLDERDE